MKRFIALGVAGALTLAGMPAFAQQGTNQQPGQNQATNPQHVDASGLGTLDQAPPPGTDNTTLLLIGGLALGAAGGIIALTVHHSDNNPVSP